MKTTAFCALASLLLVGASVARADCGYARLASGGGESEEWEATIRCRHDDAAHAAGLPDLERTPLPDGQTEIRIRYSAYGLGFDPMLRLYRYPHGRVVGSLHFEYPLETFDSPDNRDWRRWLREICVAPGRGGEMGSCRRKFQHEPRWFEIHDRLERLGIETIPDQSTVPPPPPSEDMVIVTHALYVTVEVRNAQGYRRYRYDLTRGPQAGATEQAYREILKLFDER